MGSISRRYDGGFSSDTDLILRKEIFYDDVDFV